MPALLPYPKSPCIWSDTSSLEKSTNVQLGRNACNAVFQTHVCSIVRGYILSTSPALLEEAQPDPSWAGLLHQSTFELALFWSSSCLQSQAVSALVRHDVREGSFLLRCFCPRTRGTSVLTHNSKVSISTIVHTRL